MKLSVGVLLVLVATLQNASSQCSTGSVWLDGSILSSSNGTQVAGLLMVCRDGVWGTVQTVSAIHLWSEKNALVACRSLGFEGALNIIPATQIRRVSASIPVLYESVACTGVEESLIDCPGTVSLENEFNHVADVYLVCWPGSRRYNDLHTVSSSTTSRYGDVRLVGDVVNGQGAVELYTSVGWSTVCPDSSWTDADTGIICQRLGYDSGTARTYSLSVSNSVTISPLLLRDSQCATRRQASSIFRIDGGYCSFSGVDISNPCADKGYAGVSCRTTSKEQSVRLFGLDSLSSSRFVGVVEYQLGGRWGVVCSPSIQNSQVPRIICGEVGYRQDITSFKTLNSITIQSIESRQKPAWILDFTCDSSDRRFSECGVVAPIGYGQCSRSGDILTVDCGPRRRPLTSGQVAGIVVPCVLLFLAIVLLFIFREKWVPQAKVFVQRCLKCQQFKGWKANMARSMARRREARRRRQAERRAARQAAREAREAEREAREAEREAREAAREAAASGFQNDSRMMQPTANGSPELMKTAPPPYFYPPEEAPPPYAD